MSHDGQLLADFVERAADGAFTELVRRHVNLVYATALRRLNGDTGTAADVTQQVFVALAGQAGRLRREDSIAGWLHHHTLFEASKALRSEQRRRDREREFVTMNSTESPNALWTQMAPVLDDALDRLAAKDREALLLRFFEDRDLRAVGLTLGVGEDAAQKRIARALEKLRGLLARRGVILSAVALAGLMGQQATVAAPAAVVTSVCVASLAAAATGGAAGSILAAKIATIMTTKTKIILAATLVAGGIATPLVQQHRLNFQCDETRRVFAQLEPLRQEIEELRRLKQPPPPAQASSDLARLRDENLRLRDDNARLSKENKTLTAKATKASADTQLARRRQAQPHDVVLRQPLNWHVKPGEGQNRGLATADDTLKTVLWAIQSGSLKHYQWAIGGGDVPTNMDNAQFVHLLALQQNLSQAVDMHVLQKETLANGEVSFNVRFDYGALDLKKAREENLNPGSYPQLVTYRFKLVNGTWVGSEQSYSASADGLEGSTK